MQFRYTIFTAFGLVGAAPTNEISLRQTVAVGAFNRYAGPGCTGFVCDIDGAGEVHAGCNAITDSCTASLSLAYLNPGCTGRDFRPL
jgi:hypothetical protein